MLLQLPRLYLPLILMPHTHPRRHLRQPALPRIMVSPQREQLSPPAVAAGLSHAAAGCGLEVGELLQERVLGLLADRIALDGLHVKKI